MTDKKERQDSMLPAAGRQPSQGRPRGGYQRESITEAAIKSFIRSIAGTIGRMLVRALTRRGR